MKVVGASCLFLSFLFFYLIKMEPEVEPEIKRGNGKISGFNYIDYVSRYLIYFVQMMIMTKEAINSSVCLPRKVLRNLGNKLSVK